MVEQNVLPLRQTISWIYNCHPSQAAVINFNMSEEMLCFAGRLALFLPHQQNVVAPGNK